MQLVTGTYTGNGVDDRWINDPGFEPDLVIIKADAANAAVWRTSDMGVGESFWFSVYGGAYGNRIQDFGANGFQVGTNADVNANGVDYYWAAFRDTGAADFAVGTYTGDGADDRNITGVGFQPTILYILR